MAQIIKDKLIQPKERNNNLTIERQISVNINKPTHNQYISRLEVIKKEIHEMKQQFSNFCCMVKTMLIYFNKLKQQNTSNTFIIYRNKS